MAAIVTVHHPDITEEEREIRIERIKQAMIKFYLEVEKAKKAELED